MTANELRKEQKAVILHVKASGLREKLTEMGCIEGDMIKRLYTAPMGDPVAFEVNGYTLALRLDEASMIEVGGSSTDEK